MYVQPHMVNGQRIAHGGFIFLLANSAFAFACNSHNERAVAAQCQITFIKPGKLGDRLVATAREISRSGRSGIYDIRVTANDVVIAEFRGHSRTVGGTWLLAPGELTSAKNKRVGGARWLRRNRKSKERLLPRRDGRDRARLARRDHGAADQAPRLVARSTPTTMSRITRRRSMRPACIRRDFKAALRSRQIPVHGEDRSARQLPLQHVRGAARKAGPRPRFFRHDRQADRGRLHPGPISTSGRT